MPDTISEHDVRRIARLARLELTEDEVRRFAAQLAEILAYADQVQQVDTAAVRVSDSAAVSADQPLRDDEVRPALSREDALSNAPDPDPAGFFKVPRVLG